VKNGQIEACNPLKLREYLAVGKAVVATDFPAVRHFSQYVTIADDADGFVDALKSALRESAEMSALRRRRVSRESWQAVADQINRLIEAS
jgi:glycosyltransferase involved in cell wall biosynthesis